jgi:hypothetical protein
MTDDGSMHGEVRFAPCGDQMCNPGPRHYEIHSMSMGTSGSMIEDCIDTHDPAGPYTTCTTTTQVGSNTTTQTDKVVYLSDEGWTSGLVLGDTPIHIIEQGGWLHCVMSPGPLEVVTSVSGEVGPQATPVTNSCVSCGFRGFACLMDQWTGGTCDAGGFPHRPCANGIQSPCYPSACPLVPCDQ